MDAREDEAWYSSRGADRGRGEVDSGFVGHPRDSRNRRARSTRGGVPETLICLGSWASNTLTGAAHFKNVHSAMHHKALCKETIRVRDRSIAEVAKRVQGTIPASPTDPPGEARDDPQNYLGAEHSVSGIESVSHSRTICTSARCDGGYIPS